MTPDSELEAALRSALRRRPPEHDLAAPVLARMRRSPTPRRWRWAVALAAVIVLAVGLAEGLATIRRRQVLQRQAARADAIELARALRLAAADLNRIRSQVSR